MKIIGHRGAAGLALENTLPSIELARLLGVDAIEFDVRKTKDNKLVLCHDDDLSRVSDSDAKVKDLTLSQLRKITLSDQQSKVPTLKEALRMAGNIPVHIELKTTGCAEILLTDLEDFPKLDVSVISFKVDELSHLKKLRPKMKLFGLDHTNPFESIQRAKMKKFHGIGLNFWLLNPLTYWFSKRHNLDVYVYTVNNRFIGKFILWLYPRAAICTDRPEWFIKHPYLKLRSARGWNGKPVRKKAKR